MTDSSSLEPAKAPRAPWSRGKKWAVGGASTFAALWAMGAVSDAVGPDTITETVTTTITETHTVVETTTETHTVTEEAPAPLAESPDAPSSVPAPAAAPPSRSTHYPNCTAVRAAGAAPTYLGEPIFVLAGPRRRRSGVREIAHRRCRP